MINTKLTWEDPDRRLAEALQLNHFAKQFKDEALLVMGDFNTFPFIEHERNIFFDGDYIVQTLSADNLKEARHNLCFPLSLNL